MGQQASVWKSAKFSKASATIWKQLSANKNNKKLKNIAIHLSFKDTRKEKLRKQFNIIIYKNIMFYNSIKSTDIKSTR